MILSPPLPGDIRPELVTRFGFTASPARIGSEGRGDGNGELAGFNGSTAYAWAQSGETLFFWQDLTANSRLLEGNFTSYTEGGGPSCSGTSCNLFWPEAKIGNANLLYVYSGYALGCCTATTGIGPNYIGITRLYGISAASNVGQSPLTPPAPGLTVAQAYNMDKKVDDAIPLTGTVMAQFLGNGLSQGIPTFAPNAASASSSTCYDTTSGQYSITQNGGNGLNCALSFQLK